MSQIIPVVMAGGNGTRLWPLSRGLYPKQFLTLQGSHTMLQNTLLRLSELHCVSPLVISNESHRFLVAEQLRELNMLSRNIILEPIGRNTAPAIALAAMQSQQQNNDESDPLLLVLAADHVIKDELAFCDAVKKAIPYAQSGKLVTFGIVPTAPETGYGYIQRGDALILDSDKSDAYAVAEFVEKPDLVTAQHYIEKGSYYWNSGMFLFKASRYLSELKQHRPDIFDACQKSMAAISPDLDFIRVDKTAFTSCPDDSIDYAVMEKTLDAVVVPMDAGWSDVGSWSSLWEISEKDGMGNVSQGDVLLHNSANNYIFAESSLVTTVGVTDLVIVQTKDAMLVAARDQVQDVKKIVELIKNNHRCEHHSHRVVYRPWGKYDSIDQGDRYQVKRISIKPGEQLSLQMHHHRAEHWVVVQGTAKVICGDEIRLLTENQSFYIPLGIKHSLENPGKIPLEVIEVRSGSYLEDDDIERFWDKYGRQ